jgi:hypothetical protein
MRDGADGAALGEQRDSVLLLIAGPLGCGQADRGHAASGHGDSEGYGAPEGYGGVDDHAGAAEASGADQCGGGREPRRLGIDQTGRLRSWVVGWAHRLEANPDVARSATTRSEVPRGLVGRADPRRPDERGPQSARHTNEWADPGMVVRRLAEAVVDVLLERRPAEQVRRWVSRDVFGLLTTGAPRREPARFAARSMVRSIRLHQPAPDAVESTVLVQDGARVRAIALRFERAVPPPVRREPASGYRPGPAHPDWLCTALQFG